MRRFLVPKEVSTASSSVSDERSSSPQSKRPRLDLTSNSTSIPSSSMKSTLSISSSLIPKAGGGKRYQESILPASHKAFAASLPVNQWVEFEGLLVKLHSQPPLPTATPWKGIIALDMDGTVITTKSGKRHAINGKDWQFWHPQVIPTLRYYHEENYALAFISNQGGIQAGKTSRAELQDKVDEIINTLGMPIDFICSLEKDLYRKPRPGMWHFLSSARWAPSGLFNALEKNGDSSDDSCLRMVYVGDAAGRLLPASKIKDFSDSDLKFAANLDIEFQTPESFFLKSQLKVHTDLTSNLAQALRVVDKVGSWSVDDQRVLKAGDTGQQEIVLLVGPPASGKSTLSQKFVEQGYGRINQDTLGTLPACLKAARAELSAGKSIVVDNTNSMKERRAPWISLAKEKNLPIRCIVLEVTKELCFTLQTLRLLDPLTPPSDRREIKDVVLHTYFKNMQKPELAEGFERISSLPWIANLDVPSATNPKAIVDENIKLREALLHMYLK